MRNVIKRERFARFLNLAVGSTLLMGGASSTITQVLAADQFSITMRYLLSDEKTYGIDHFNEDYSKGILFRSPSTIIDVKKYQT